MKTIYKIIDLIIRAIYFWKKINTGAFADTDEHTDAPAKLVLTKTKKLPDVYLNEKILEKEKYNQGHLGICVACAQTTQLELANQKDLSVRFSYRMAKYLDGITYGKNYETMEGTWGRTMAKVHQKYGDAETKYRPEAWKLSHWLYNNFTFTKSEITNAKKHKILRYVFAQNQEEIKQGVLQYGSVSITVKADEVWEGLNGYHRVLIVGWDENGWVIRNSWDYSKTSIRNKFGYYDFANQLEYIGYDVNLIAPIIYVFDEKKIKKIDNYIKETKYKYFSSKEAKDIDVELMKKLDKLRELTGKPIIILSGYRTKEHNKAIGGVKNSCHILKPAKAVDIRVWDNKHMFDIIKTALKLGFTRIGINNGSVHLDICDDKEHPKERIWTYYK